MFLWQKNPKNRVQVQPVFPANPVSSKSTIRPTSTSVIALLLHTLFKRVMCVRVRGRRQQQQHAISELRTCTTAQIRSSPPSSSLPLRFVFRDSIQFQRNPKCPIATTEKAAANPTWCARGNDISHNVTERGSDGHERGRGEKTKCYTIIKGKPLARSTVNETGDLACGASTGLWIKNSCSC